MKYSRDGAVERDLAENSETRVSGRTENAVLQKEHTDEQLNVRDVSSEQPEPEHKRVRHSKPRPQYPKNIDKSRNMCYN